VCSVIVESATEALDGHGIGTGMSRARKLANLAGTVLPLVGLIVAIVLLWNRMVGPRELVILFVGYVLAGIGITVGYHRLFTHRSFQTYRWVRYVFAILGQCAVEGNVVSWVANHRKHHQFSDQSGDPHSPHAGYGTGVKEAIKGLWHAHTGWVFDDDATVKLAACAPVADRMYASTELLLSLAITPLVPCVQGELVAEIDPEPAGSAIALIYTREPALVGFRDGVLMGVVPVVGAPCKSLSNVAVPPVYENSTAWIDSPWAMVGVAVMLIAALDGALRIYPSQMNRPVVEYWKGLFVLKVKLCPLPSVKVMVNPVPEPR